jgi:hypothetical protein
MVCEWFGLKTTWTVSHRFGPQNQWRMFAWFGLKTTWTVFAGLASKPVTTVFSSLPLKLMATVSTGLTSKSVVHFMVEPQNQGGGGFPGLGLKITATVSWFMPQNQVGFSLSVAPQNRRRKVGTGHVSRPSGLLRVEASLVSVLQSGLKTDGGATVGGSRGTIAKVASESS